MKHWPKVGSIGQWIPQKIGHKWLYSNWTCNKYFFNKYVTWNKNWKNFYQAASSNNYFIILVLPEFSKKNSSSIFCKYFGRCFFSFFSYLTHITYLHSNTYLPQIETHPFDHCKSSVIRQKGETQNGCFKKTKHVKFSEKQTFLPRWYAHVRVRISG